MRIDRKTARAIDAMPIDPEVADLIDRLAARAENDPVYVAARADRARELAREWLAAARRRPA